jgi:hypothetical protein
VFALLDMPANRIEPFGDAPLPLCDLTCAFGNRPFGVLRTLQFRRAVLIHV